MEDILVSDDELVYLIRQNNEEAKRLLFLRYETFKRNIDSDEYKFENLTNFYLKDNGKMYIVFAYGNLNFTSEMDIIEI